MFRWYPADRLFYYPTVKTYESPESSGLDVESVYFQSADRARLHGLFFPATGSVRGTVLHFHGNAGNVTGHWPFIAWLPPAGWNVLCFDYRGFGCSRGRISQRRSILDGHAALDYVLSRQDVDPARIVAFGQSLGGAVAVAVGAERSELRAFLLEATFSGYRSIARWHLAQNPLLLALAWWVPPLLIDHCFDAVKHIARVAPRPILIVHGMEDRTVPWQMAVELYRAAGEPKELWHIPDLGHLESIDQLPPGALTRISSFFEGAVSPASAPSITDTRGQS